MVLSLYSDLVKSIMRLRTELGNSDALWHFKNSVLMDVHIKGLSILSPPYNDIGSACSTLSRYIRGMFLLLEKIAKPFPVMI